MFLRQHHDTCRHSESAGFSLCFERMAKLPDRLLTLEGNEVAMTDAGPMKTDFNKLARTLIKHKIHFTTTDEEPRFEIEGSRFTT